MPKPKYDDVNDFLMGGEKIPSASFLKLHTRHEGEILNLAKRQQLDIDDRRPKFWENGDPMMQLVITLQTDEIDDEIEDDDGRRNLYVKYKMKDAIADAVREAEAENGIEIGGWLAVEWVKSEKPQNRAKSGTKIYEAEYEPPDPAAAAQAYLDGDDPDETDDEPEEAPPARSRRKTTTNKAASSKAATTRSRRRAEPEEDEPEPEPARPARRSRAKAGATAGRSRRSSRSEFVDEGGDGEEPF